MMTLLVVIGLGIKTGTAFAAFVPGLNTLTHSWIVRYPARLVWSVLAVNMTIPAAVLLMIAVTGLPVAVRIAQASLPVSPSGRG
jgi:anaerobic C4-dicarboxylate transporter